MAKTTWGEDMERYFRKYDLWHLNYFDDPIKDAFFAGGRSAFKIYKNRKKRKNKKRESKDDS